MPKTYIPQTALVEKETGRPTQAWHQFFNNITNFPKVDVQDFPKVKPDGFVVLNLNGADVYVPYWNKLGE